MPLILLRRSPTLLRHLRCAPRLSSTLADSLQATLKARHLPILFDYLTVTPSFLLAQDLGPILSIPTKTFLPSVVHDIEPFLPAAHLLYFPDSTPLSSLLPDGTNPQEFPGEPFTRRLWAGGKMVFYPAHHFLKCANQRAACVQRIRNVRVEGDVGQEKVFVGLERHVLTGRLGRGEAGMNGTGGLDGQPTRMLGARATAGEKGGVRVTELRDLVFLRPVAGGDAAAESRAATEKRRIVKGSIFLL